MAATIGIVGSGAVGRALAAHVVASGRNVVLCNSRSPATLESAVDDLGPRASALETSAVAAADLVVLAIPWHVVVPLLEQLPPWHGRTLIDATAPASHLRLPQPHDLGGLTSSELVQASAAGARVVKAFCTLPASVLALPPANAAGRRVMFLSGDDAEARAVVSVLIDDIGYAPVDLGSLAAGSALQQPGGPLAGLDLRRAD
ncbi:NADP oxidoreductase [Kribbella pittospori]|uniref:NADP oxidoreductase n=1 Tax=Kribbella pittospori TaxID=722689 RepID=A0A4R0K8Y0_9ACTN|nr:NAD(P)-binding domain-containing protein [Kribbella pittospori]TCC54378.1 NADP oxidoreductase [Kribbella pittospori]